MIDPVDWTGLVARVKAGEQDAATELYRVFRSVTRKICERSKEPEDLLQTCYLRIWRFIMAGRVRDAAKLPGLMARMAHRMAIDEWRLARLNVVSIDHGMLYTIPLAEPNPETAMIAGQERRRRIRAVRDRVRSQPVALHAFEAILHGTKRPRDVSRKVWDCRRSRVMSAAKLAA